MICVGAEHHEAFYYLVVLDVHADDIAVLI